MNPDLLLKFYVVLNPGEYDNLRDALGLTPPLWQAIEVARAALAGPAQPAPPASGTPETVSCPRHGRKELREDGDTYFCPECEGKP